jgi:hypothetical protein
MRDIIDIEQPRSMQSEKHHFQAIPNYWVT